MSEQEKSVKEWDFNPSEILASTRKVQGIFHQPIVDKDGEIISSDGMRKAVPDFMHLPALHDFHKERPVGLATKVKELSGGRFWFEGVIKSTSDCDDIWEKVKTGNYDQVSIFGKRTKYNNQCSLPQNMRSGPCVTDGVRLDSISVCDENARNPQTSLEVKKAKTVFDADMMKAETTSGNLQHASTDYAEKKDFEKSKARPRNVRVSVEGTKRGDNPSSNLGLTDSFGNSAFTTPERSLKKKIAKSCPCKKDATTISKDDMEKAGDYEEQHGEFKEETSPTRKESPKISSGKKKVHASSRAMGNPIFEHEAHASKPTPRTNPTGHKGTTPPAEDRDAENRTAGAEAIMHYEAQASRNKYSGNIKETEHRKPVGRSAVKKSASAHVEANGEEYDMKEVEKGKRPKVEEEPAESGSTSQKQRKNIKEVEKSAAEDYEEESYDEDEDPDFDKVKQTDKEQNWSKTKGADGTPGLKKAKKEDEESEDEDEEEEEIVLPKKQTKDKTVKKAKGDEDAASESFNPSTVTKGEHMDEEQNDMEYVTKALVPIEEIDTIVKARTEEISKAYMGQLEEIKKAYDAKFVEMSSKLEKMENETIRKGGQVVVIPELLGGNGAASMSNADAVARMQAGR